MNDKQIQEWKLTEIAYRLPGGTWKRATPKTRRAFCKKVADLVTAGAEVRLSPAI